MTVTTLGVRQPTGEEQRVQAGAAWLDETYPGWDKLIDLDALNMEYCEGCILGQVYPHGCYCDAMSVHLINETKLGFYHWHQPNYGPLEAAWRAEIERRRQQSER